MVAAACDCHRQGNVHWVCRKHGFELLAALHKAELDVSAVRVIDDLKFDKPSRFERACDYALSAIVGFAAGLAASRFLQ